jgi:hypothetical protein
LALRAKSKVESAAECLVRARLRKAFVGVSYVSRASRIIYHRSTGAVTDRTTGRLLLTLQEAELMPWPEVIILHHIILKDTDGGIPKLSIDAAGKINISQPRHPSRITPSGLF